MQIDREHEQLRKEIEEYRKFLDETKQKIEREITPIWPEWGEIYEKIDRESFFEELDTVVEKLDRLCDIACGSDVLSRKDYADLMHAYEIIRYISYSPQPIEEV